MTKGEAKMLENDKDILSLNFNQESKNAVLQTETAENFAAGNNPDKTNVKVRFARLKKSLRKRSVSIL